MDDATAAGELSNLREWWDNLVTSGPNFGHFVNASKTSLVVEEGHLADAVKYFENKFPQRENHILEQPYRHRGICS